MKIIELNLPDLSNHPPEPQVDLGVFEAWVRGDSATRTRSEMTDDEIHEHFMNNEGRMAEFRYVS